MIDRTEFDSVLKAMVNRMVPMPWRQVPSASEKPKVVLLLGAGCSRQYGLPSFVELLTYLWEDCLRVVEVPQSLELLRDKLDKFWQAQGPEDRLRILKYYLDRPVKGEMCPGHLQLARLAKQGYIHAVLNMNFDTLLEQALDSEKVDYRVTTSFLVQDPKRLVVYKPHGSLGRVDSENAVDGLLNAVYGLIQFWEQPGIGGDGETRRAFSRAQAQFQEESESQRKNEQAERVTTAVKELILKTLEALEAYGSESAKSHLGDLKQMREELARMSRGPGYARNELILDIANSDLFADPDEQQAAQALLTGYDVISIGYSGVDAKIAAALRAFPPDKDPKDRKLFVVNATRPDPRLLLVMAERTSQDLLISGDAASFENFAINLSRKLDNWKNSTTFSEMTSEARGRPNFMTSVEQEALEKCLRLALEIRMSLNIAEQSKTSIADHGIGIFNDCLDLAQGAGICLSSAEKYLLHCAAFLHDLGYYRGYTRSKVGQFPGWALLRRHGELTKELLEERFREDDESLSSIMPESYKEMPGTGPKFATLLCELCAGHSGLVDVDPCIPDGELLVEGGPVAVRFSLLVRLFALAEDLSEGHPFFPSADPVGPARGRLEKGGGRKRWAIFDPVLDLYLYGERPIVFKRKRGRVVATRSEQMANQDQGHQEREGETREKTLRWLLVMAAAHIERFSRAARDVGGWGIKLEYGPGLTPLSEFPDLENINELIEFYEICLREALSESFSLALKRIPEGSLGEDTSILDLVAIYSLDEGRLADGREEPRIPCPSSTLEDALSRVRRYRDLEHFIPSSSVMSFYFDVQRRREADWTTLDRMFLLSFKGIFYPASRFFGRNWHDGIESTLMARICFDMGFSRFRWEVVDGIRRLLDEKITLSQNHCYGHSKCTLCTSRLLYIFVYAKGLIPRDELGRCAEELDQAISGILSYMMSLDSEDDIWWGLEASDQGKIKSAEYLAWAARATTRCLAMGWESQQYGKEREGLVLGHDVESGLKRLVRERWDHLLSATEETLLSSLAEEPHSFVFGHVALALLDLERQHPGIRAIAVEGREEKLVTFAKALDDAANKIGTRSQLSEFFLWPLLLVHDSRGDEEAGMQSVRVCLNCLRSPVWIKSGADTGSWGFNVKNTQTIVTSLWTFWEYVLEDEGRKARFAEYFDLPENATHLKADS